MADLNRICVDFQQQIKKLLNKERSFLNTFCKETLEITHEELHVSM